MYGFTYSCLFTPRDRRNARIFGLWTIAWILSFSIATVLIGERIVDSLAIGLALGTITVILALVAVRSYLVFLRHADELLRRIQLEGLAWGFAASAVFMLCYTLFERLGAPKLDVLEPFVLMTVFWAIGQYVGLRRYGIPEEP